MSEVNKKCPYCWGPLPATPLPQGYYHCPQDEAAHEQTLLRAKIERLAASCHKAMAERDDLRRRDEARWERIVAAVTPLRIKFQECCCGEGHTFSVNGAAIVEAIRMAWDDEADDG